MKDYSEVTIESDGVLEVAPGSGWVIIGVNGDVKIDGKIVTRGQHIGGTVKANLPDANGVKGKGKLISYVITQKAGGMGGKHQGTGAPAGGKTSSGNGGGGGGGGAGGNGGRLVLKLTEVLKMLPSQIKLSGSAGGAGGAAGKCPGWCGSGGGAGKAGLTGTWSK